MHFSFLHVAHAPGVILADYNSGWKEHRRFGLMTLRNLGLGRQSMERSILGEIHGIVQLLEQSVGTSVSSTNSLAIVCCMA